MNRQREEAAARWLNLLIPGGGLILLGRTSLGLVIALVFTVSANLALAANLLFPDDFSGWAAGVITGLAAGTYLGAQLRLAQTVRTRERQATDALRRAALAAARAHLANRRYDQAWEALRPVLDQADRDLLIAYRVAQVLTAKRDVDAALAAWRRVRNLDRHRIYREQIRSHERALGQMT